MSTSEHSSATDVDAGSENEAPQLSALFLIKFDKKVGYVMLPLMLRSRPQQWTVESTRLQTQLRVALHVIIVAQRYLQDARSR